MTFLLDVNVLMALLWENHEHHQVARTWFGGVTDFATCPVAQLGFARVSSHPALGYSMSPDQAFSILRSFLADSRHRFVSDDLSSEDRALRTDLMEGANQITDHYLVAIARHHHLTVATFDEPLANAFSKELSLVQLIR
jgi:toxin-antitoxin system PIN domain toxin